jgi:opacity protein-like surface antigen
MKRLCILAAAAVMTGAAVFAAPKFSLSAGAGGLFSINGIYRIKTGADSQTITAVGGGAYVFFDAVFAETTVEFFGGLLNGNIPDDWSSTGLNLSFLGKYPFVLGRLTLFPLAGIDYRIALSIMDEMGRPWPVSDTREYNALWFQFGGGADYAITESLYLRGEFLYGFRLRNKEEKDDIRTAGTWGLRARYKIGRGPTLKIAVGYKFF